MSLFLFIIHFNVKIYYNEYLEMEVEMKKLIKLISIVVLIGLLALSGSYIAYNNLKGSVSENDKIIIVDIPSGTSLKKAANILREHNLINNERVFLLYARFNDLENIKSGEYSLSENKSTDEILRLLNKGSHESGTKITIPEGFEIMNIADRLSENGLVDRDKFISAAEDSSIFKDKYEFLNSDDIQSLEGYLFPDTYYISDSQDEIKIIEMMLDRFSTVYKEQNLEEYISKNNLSLNYLITMASIIEREAVISEERPVISGVFYNRLERDMPLQSCATVQYILKERKPVLSIKDTKIESPYNTYLNKGLPPAPIASPGLDSITAAIYPVETDYIYFVAKGDGGHEFSVTYDDHLKAKNKYLSQ